MPKTQQPELQGRRAELLEKDKEESASWLPWDLLQMKLGMFHTLGMPSRGP